MIGNESCTGCALRIAIGITALVLLLAGGAGAATLTVDDSGGADYTRIQDAVNAKLNVPSEQVPENYQRTAKSVLGS